MNVGIIHIGDELLTGKINPYPAEMIEAIRSKGADVSFIQVITDDIEVIVRALSYSQNSNVDVVIVTGGLGPTLDDITREAVAEYMGAELEMDQDSIDYLEQFMKKRHPEKEIEEISKRMARVPQGAEAVRNICGAACGIKAVVKNVTIFCLPGFPNEMMPMFYESILPMISGNDEISEELTIFINESDVDPYFRQISEKYGVRVASLPSLDYKKIGNKVVIKGKKEKVLLAKEEFENCINSQ